MTTTGFATISRNVCNFLKDDFEIHYLSHNYWGQTLKPPIKFMDGEGINFICHGTGRARYAVDKISPLIKKYSIDIIGGLLDTFMLSEAGFINIDTSPAKTFWYYPSDGGGVLPDRGNQEGANILRKVNLPISMSRFARDQAKKVYGIESEYIPHAFDPKLFYMLSAEERKKVRQKWGLLNKFVVGTVARNQGRKMLDRTFKSFKLFCKDFPEAVLFMHTDPNDPAQTFIMIELINRYNLNNRVVFTGASFYNPFGYTQMNEVYNAMDVFFLSSCIHPEMGVDTKEGIKKIKNIKVGDKLLSSSGRYRKVLKVIPNRWNGKILKIKANGLLELKVTPNHNIYTVKCKNPEDKRKIVKNPVISLEQAGNLSKYDYLLYPVPKTTETKKSIKTSYYIKKGRNQFGAKFIHPTSHKLPDKVVLDYKFGLLCGFYLSEGCYTKDGIALCFNTKERKYYYRLKKILKERFSLTIRLTHKTRNRTTLWTTNKALGRMFSDLFGSKSHFKRLPEWILNSPKEFRRGLIEGLWKGDGCYWKNKNYNGYTWELQTVSEQLGHQLFNLLIAEGFIPSLSKNHRNSMVYRIRLNNYQNLGKYVKIKQEPCRKIKSRFFKNNDFVYYPISKITEECYTGLVYDLTVEKEHNYCCNCLVKNSGEGFGIPIIEAMACGVPQLCTDYTTTKELVIDDGKSGEAVLLSGEKEQCPYPHTDEVLDGTLTGSYNVERGLMSVYDGANKLKMMHTHWKNKDSIWKDYVNNSIKKANKYYTWEVVMKDWRKVLKKLLE